MIYLWYPAFQSGDQELDISQVTGDWSDVNLPIDMPRTRIKLRNPDFYDSLEKPLRIETKRSMSGVLRTYVIRDRVDMDVHYVTMQFAALRKERVRALEHFIMCAKGSYIGYKDPDNVGHATKLEAQSIVIQTEARAGGPGPGAVDYDDEHSKVAIRLMIVRTYDAIDWS